MTYDDKQIAERLGELPAWSYAGGVITATFKTGGWPATLMLANAIGYAAEAADHHPDLLLKYSSLQVSLSTHSAGGITEKDFSLARRIHELVALTA